jgi:DNA replication protein DnaC
VRSRTVTGRKENVLLVGNSGPGKTHLVSTLAFAACSQGRKVRFYTVMDLVTELMESQDERRLQRLQKQLRGLELIVLDELCYIPFSRARTELLFEVVSHAYEYQSLIVASNLPFDQ